MAVVEGYTDVIAAHQVGLCNVVGTLGTALGDDHVQGLRRLADRVVLVFDGDDAGQNAADRALEFFLGHELDVRVLSLPANLDPCDFLLKEGAEAFRALVERAVDPLAFVLERAGERFDLDSIEGARQAAEWVLGILARLPSVKTSGLRLARATSRSTWRSIPWLDGCSCPWSRSSDGSESSTRSAAGSRAPVRTGPGPSGIAGRNGQSTTGREPAGELSTRARRAPPSRSAPPADLDPIDRELVQIVLERAASVA